MTLRAYPDPQHPDGLLSHSAAGQQVILRHPSLPHPNRLIAFPAVDQTEDNKPGVNYLLVHSACSIIACNRYDGFLERVGGAVVDGAANYVLPAGEYNFVVPGFADPYPVIPSLSHYTFHDSHVPLQWRSLSNVRTPPTRPTRASLQASVCRVTKHTRCVEKAHIIPRHEEQWFKSSEMRDFAPAPDNSADEAFNSLANRIGLRSDVHTLWDDHEFVFVPKFDHAQGHCLVAHSLVNDVEVVSLYHDTRVQELDHVPYQYLYLRFVIAILRRVPQFIKESQPVPLSIRSAQYEYELKELDWTSAVTLMREDGRHPSTGRKKSPRKRSRSQNERNCSCDASTPRSSHNSVDDSSSTTDISIDDTSACPSDDDDTAHRTTKRRHLLCPTSGAKGPIFELEESCSGALTFKEVPGNDWTAVLEQYDRGRPRKRMRT